jgi:transcriptional repressor NrdR
MFRSLSLALRKRDVEQVKIEKIVNAIVRKLENSGETEIKSNLIGEYVMEALSHLDQVAYVRFASVYKNFREVKDFEEFLGNLEDK